MQDRPAQGLRSNADYTNSSGIQMGVLVVVVVVAAEVEVEPIYYALLHLHRSPPIPRRWVRTILAVGIYASIMLHIYSKYE